MYNIINDFLDASYKFIVWLMIIIVYIIVWKFIIWYRDKD